LQDAGVSLAKGLWAAPEAAAGIADWLTSGRAGNNVVGSIPGHAQPLSSMALTPSGFVRMGDIHVGDEK
jgi:hypothetical protein